MNKAMQFLQKHGQTAAQVDAQSQIAGFIGEMKKGLCGAVSSIPMIPTYLCNVDRSKIHGGKNILIDAGGTNFRSAAGYFDQTGKVQIEDLQKTVMPASRGETLSKEEFYGKIAENIRRLADCDNVGFCFSYPVNMGADLDGEVTSFSKEVRAPEVVGTRVGAETLRAMQKYSPKSRKIVILNDTVATLLGGMAISEREYSTYLGYIYGTGTNICCIADTAQISKVANLPRGKMLVNMECGGYNGFVQGDFDKAAILQTAAPDKQLFEKMTSGKYLSTIIYQALCAAEKEGQFADTVHLAQPTLADVSQFLSDGGAMDGWFASVADADFARDVCRELICRAAKMGAVANAATAMATCENKALPVAIVAEGTTFNRLVGYRAQFEKYLREFLDAEGISFQIVQGEELNLVGTLMATQAL